VSSTDVEWVNMARKGDQEAFSRLVEQYQTPVFHLCYRMLGNESDAEDAAQETFLRAYQNLKRYDPNRSFITCHTFALSFACRVRIIRAVSHQKERA